MRGDSVGDQDADSGAALSVDAYERRLIWWNRVKRLLVLMFAAGLFAFASADSNSAFLCMSLCGFALLPLMIAALVAKSWTLLTMTGLAVGLIVFSGKMIGVHTDALEQRFQPTIDALEAYRVQHGVYPPTQRYLIDPASGIVHPECTSNILAFYFERVVDGEPAFSLGCTTFAFNKHWYRSEHGRWISWD